MTVGVAIDWRVDKRDDGEEDMKIPIEMLKEIERLLEDVVLLNNIVDDDDGDEDTKECWTVEEALKREDFLTGG